MKSALEIAHEAQLRPISEVASGAGILPEELEQCGEFRGKVRLSTLDRLSSRNQAIAIGSRRLIQASLPAL